MEKVWGHLYVDLRVIFKWYQKGPCPNMAPNPSEPAMVDMPLAFQIEHLLAFPKDALSMPGHMDQDIKMKMTGMQWQKYDMLIRQKRGKKISRESKKVGSWATTDVILYLECQQPRPATKTQGLSWGARAPPCGSR